KPLPTPNSQLDDPSWELGIGSGSEVGSWSLGVSALLLVNDDAALVAFVDVILVAILAGGSVVVLLDHTHRDDLAAGFPLKRDHGSQVFLQRLLVLLSEDGYRKTRR